MRKKPAILIVYTGGTVGMIETTEGVLRPFGWDELLQQIPEIKRLDFDLGMHAFSPPIDSSNMNPEIWAELVEIIDTNYNKYDGFVILHGSDTMAFTASALSFMLENLQKPIVLTGSQLPISVIRTDARENIITALEIAAAYENGKAIVPEVCIYFDYSLFRGNRSKKYNAEKFEAFYSMNYPPLAEAGISLKYKREYIAKANDKLLKVHKAFSTDITVLKLFPGISAASVNAILATPGLKAVVMETFGSGNAITAPWFINAIANAIKRNIIILDISQCDGGAVELGRYETSQHLLEAGVISGNDMTFEAAVTKLMFLLSSGLTNNEIKEQLQRSLRGELSNKLN
jgi:L-asparaginase